MICDICSKNQATVHLTEIIDDQMSELHLCEACAHKKSTQMEQKFGLSDLLAGLADLGQPKCATTAGGLKCSNCGLSYTEFKRIGRLGCGQCYSNFKECINPLLKKIHGSTSHVGKTPLNMVSKTAKKSNLAELRNSLQKAIDREEFEEAAMLRDKIRGLEKDGTK